MKCIAVNGIPSHSYGVSLATWDHTVLPATRHKWAHPALTPAILDLPPPDGWKAELTYRWLVTYRDGLPARRRSPIQVLTGPINYGTLIEANALTTSLHYAAESFWIGRPNQFCYMKCLYNGIQKLVPMKWLRRHQNHWNVNHTASHSLAVWLTFQLSRCWRLSFRVLSVIAATAAVICLTALNAPACTPMERLTANVETGVDYIYAPLSNTIWWVCVVTWWTCSSGVKHLDDKNATNVVHFHSRVFSRPKVSMAVGGTQH